MAGDDSGKTIVRIETDPNAGTAEGTIYVCADGSRWQKTTNTYPTTGRQLAKRRGNQIIPTE